jgi:hypothetical protein
VCWLRIKQYIRHVHIKCSCFALFRTELLQCGRFSDVPELYLLACGIAWLLFMCKYTNTHQNYVWYAVSVSLVKMDVANIMAHS